ncbi:hypothetical protein TrRE_jg10832, partial [Triparma retinervis]
MLISRGLPSRLNVVAIRRSLSTFFDANLTPLENRKKDDIRKYELECRVRKAEEQGSRKSRGLRRSGRIPGVIFGNNTSDSVGGKLAPHNNRILITTCHEALLRELAANKVPGGTAIESRVYDMTFMDDYDQEGGPKVEKGEVIKVIPRHLEMHPIHNEVVCLNFLRYWPGRVLKVPLLY